MRSEVAAISAGIWGTLLGLLRLKLSICLVMAHRYPHESHSFLLLADQQVSLPAFLLAPKDMKRDRAMWQPNDHWWNKTKMNSTEFPNNRLISYGCCWNHFYCRYQEWLWEKIGPILLIRCMNQPNVLRCPFVLQVLFSGQFYSLHSIWYETSCQENFSKQHYCHFRSDSFEAYL